MINQIITTQQERDAKLAELLPLLTPTQFFVVTLEAEYFIYASKHGIDDPATVEKMNDLILSGKYLEAAEFITGLMQDADGQGAAE